MSVFPGGSAYAMAHQIADGYLLVTERTFMRMQRPDLDKLNLEMDRLLREIRGEQPSLDDTIELQKRNRRIMRLTSGKSVLQSFRMKFKR